ncbi:MAG: SDR family oxidoreductase [Saprospiraceae bacterium]
MKILITGVEGQIGNSLRQAMLEKGHEVFGIDLKVAEGHENPGEGKERIFTCDLSDSNQVSGVLGRIHQENGPFDLVLNTAAYIYNSPVLSMHNGKFQVHSFGEWDKVLGATLSSTFYVSAICAQAMIARSKKGCIINFSSICASGNIGQSAYSAAKAGINALTLTMAKELSPLGIRVVAIAPGYFDTVSTHAAMDQHRLEEIRKRIPLKRLGKIDAIIHAVNFIWENEYVNGKVLEIDGGLTL